MTILILVLSFLALTGTPFCNPFVFMVFHGMGGYTPFDLQLSTVDLFLRRSSPALGMSVAAIPVITSAIIREAA
jgi:hypothetical protein